MKIEWLVNNATATRSPDRAECAVLRVILAGPFFALPTYIYIYIYIYIYLSTYLPIYPSTYLPIYLSTHPSTYLSVLGTLLVQFNHLRAKSSSSATKMLGATGPCLQADIVRNGTMAGRPASPCATSCRVRPMRPRRRMTAAGRVRSPPGFPPAAGCPSLFFAAAGRVRSPCGRPALFR